MQCRLAMGPMATCVAAAWSHMEPMGSQEEAMRLARTTDTLALKYMCSFISLRCSAALITRKVLEFEQPHGRGLMPTA